MKVKIECEVAQSCLTLSDPMDCSLLGSSVNGISKARVQEWVAIAFSLIKWEELYVSHVAGYWSKGHERKIRGKQ